MTVPDINPADTVQPGLLSMCAGDFVVGGLSWFLNVVLGFGKG